MVRLMHNRGVGIFVTFGAKTKSGQGGYDVGVSAVTISSGNASGHWQVVLSGSRYLVTPTTTGDTADLNAGPYTLVMSDGTKLAIYIAANAYSVRTHTELKNLIQAAGLAYGDTIYLRETGDYSATVTITPAVPSGTWTAPLDYLAADPTAYWKYTLGVNLATGNYIVIAPHPGEVVTLTSTTRFNPDANGNGRFRLTGLNWFVDDSTQPDGSAIVNGMVRFDGGKYWAVDNCTFTGAPFTTNAAPTGPYQRRNGVHCVDPGSLPTDNITIQECTFDKCLNSVYVTGTPLRATVVKNTIRHGAKDHAKLPAGNYLRYCWNLSKDKGYDVPGNHSDHAQIGALNVTTDVMNMWVVGNLHLYGSSVQDGEGFFFDDLGTTVGTNIWNGSVICLNWYLGSYTDGLTLGTNSARSNAGTGNSFIRNNGIILDPTGGTTNAASIRIIYAGIQPSDDQNYNLVCGGGQANDIIINRLSPYSDYTANFVNGTGIFGSGVGDTRSDIGNNLRIKAGSPADIGFGGIKCAPHQDYIDFAAFTISAPWAFPAPP